MTVIAISIAFLFLVLICGGALTFLSYIVFKDKAAFSANMQTINTQLGAAYNEFKAGIEANKKLAEDLNKVLVDTQPALQGMHKVEDRVRAIEDAIKLKTRFN